MLEKGRLLKWFFFTVLVSLVPFGMVAVAFWSGDTEFRMADLWPHGELLVVSTALAADAMGGLIPTNPTASRAKIVSGGCCVLVLLISAIWYAMIQDRPGFKVDKISEGSIALFGFTVVVCACCKALAER